MVSVKTGSRTRLRVALGLDFGTESGRCVVVDVATGRELATAEYAYKHGVIDRVLPGGKTPLPPDTAVQDPRDWLDTLRLTVPKAMKSAGARSGDVVGIGVDFTACTILPIDRNGQPLCFQKKWAKNHHAWAKLWKDHSAQPFADKLNEIARRKNLAWLKRYGGKVSSEWLIPKLARIVEDAPDLYAEADRFIEGADWIVLQLTGEEKRNACCAGYKGLWDKADGYPDKATLRALHPKLANVVEEKLSESIYPVGERAGCLTLEGAGLTGLTVGIPVAVSLIDAHAAVPASGVVEPGRMAFIMGTSGCHMLLGEKRVLVEGISGVVPDGIIPGYYGYEAGQAGFGDIYNWFVRLITPQGGDTSATHQRLTREAGKLAPGAAGLVALDWWNGNRSILVDADLTGLLVGCTLGTTAADIYRTLIESTAFGTRMIIETFDKKGITTESIVASGGMPQKNPMLMQIFADVTGRAFTVAASTQCSALGAAMWGAVAAGSSGGGYDHVIEAAKRMARTLRKAYTPDKDRHAIYTDLFADYVQLHDAFGRGRFDVMKRLKRRRQA